MMNLIICFYTVIIIVIMIMYYTRKESYKKQKRQGIRMQWKRAGGAGRTLATKGTRYPQLPHPDKMYSDIHNYLWP